MMAGLAGRLAQRGHKVTLVTLDDGSADRHDPNERLDLSGADVQPVTRLCLDVMSTPKRNVGFMRRISAIRHAIREGHFDVVLSFCDNTNWLVLFATIGLSVRTIVSERSDPVKQPLGRFKERLRPILLRRADAVVCLTNSIAQSLRERMGVESSVIASAVDPAPVRRDPSANNQVARLIVIGRLESEKGIDRLLRSLAVVRDQSWILIVLGDGSQRENLMRLASELDLGDRVEWLGWVSPIWEPLVASDLLVLPSHYEGFPSVVLEAMSAAVPVLAVDVGGGVTEVLDHGVDGWITENSELALSKGLEILLNDHDLREQMASRTVAKSQQYDWDTMVDGYERLLSE